MLCSAANEVEEGLYVFARAETGHIDLVAKGIGEGVRHALAHADAKGGIGGGVNSGAKIGKDVFVRVDVTVAVAPAGVGAPVLLSAPFAPGVESHHIGPYLEYVSRVGEVHHIGRVAPCRPHIHFEPHKIAPLPETFAVTVELEEFQVHKPALDAESLDGTASDARERRRDVSLDIVAGVEVPVHDVHYWRGINSHRLEQRLSGRIVYGVV